MAAALRRVCLNRNSERIPRSAVGGTAGLASEYKN